MPHIKAVLGFSKEHREVDNEDGVNYPLEENEMNNLKEKPKWYEWYICKVWRANYAMNQNSTQKMFALDWGLKTKFVDKPHYCSLSDRDHKIFHDYEKYKKDHPNEKMRVIILT